MRLESLARIRTFASDHLWRFVILALIVTVISLVLGQQTINPQHRMIKTLVLLVAVVVLARYSVTYSIYFFIVLMPFPTGIVLTSSNVILMTLIILLTLVRALATGGALFRKSGIDKWILVFLLAYVTSFFNVDTRQGLTGGIKVLWRDMTAIGFFYLIVTYIDDEKKIDRVMKLFGIMGGIIALTTLVELIHPGFSLVPGWIQARQRLGMGTLGYRLEGMRASGIWGHNFVSDMCALNFWFIVPQLLRARNSIEKLLWGTIVMLTFGALSATANRGATLSLGIAFVYSLWVFRRYFNLTRYVIVISTVVAAFLASQIVLQKYTVALSIIDRFANTKFEGMTPDTRVGVWAPIVERCMEHIFLGHGPFYETQRGLVRYYWPHNGYLYYLFTLGLFGVSVFLVILYKLLRISLKYSDRLVSGSPLGLVLSILNVQLVFFIVGQLRTDHQRSLDTLYIYVVWMLFGLICAAGNIFKRRVGEAVAVSPPG